MSDISEIGNRPSFIAHDRPPSYDKLSPPPYYRAVEVPSEEPPQQDALTMKPVLKSILGRRNAGLSVEFMEEGLRDVLEYDVASLGSGTSFPTKNRNIFFTKFPDEQALKQIICEHNFIAGNSLLKNYICNLCTSFPEKYEYIGGVLRELLKENLGSIHLQRGLHLYQILRPYVCSELSLNYPAWEEAGLCLKDEIIILEGAGVSPEEWRDWHHVDDRLYATDILKLRNIEVRPQEWQQYIENPGIVQAWAVVDPTLSIGMIIKLSSLSICLEEWSIWRDKDNNLCSMIFQFTPNQLQLWRNFKQADPSLRIVDFLTLIGPVVGPVVTPGEWGEWKDVCPFLKPLDFFDLRENNITIAEWNAWQSRDPISLGAFFKLKEANISCDVWADWRQNHPGIKASWVIELVRGGVSPVEWAAAKQIVLDLDVSDFLELRRAGGDLAEWGEWMKCEEYLSVKYFTRMKQAGISLDVFAKHKEQASPFLSVKELVKSLLASVETPNPAIA